MVNRICIGCKVRRVTTDAYYWKQVGEVKDIDGDRAWVQWANKRTWYKLTKLTQVTD